MNPVRYWKKRKLRLDRKARFQGIRQGLKRHVMMSLVLNRIDFDEIEERYIKQDFFTVELLYLMRMRKLMNPVLLHVLWNKVQRERMDWVEFPHNRHIAVPVLSLCISSFASTGATGLGSVTAFMERRDTSRKLRFLASYEGLRQKGFKKLFCHLEQMITTSKDIESLVFFLERVIEPETLEGFKRGLFINQLSLPGLTTKLLVDLTKDIRRFKNPEFLIKGISLVDLRGNHQTGYGVFFAQTLEETGCSETELKTIIERIRQPGRPFEKIPYFHQRVRMMVDLRQQGFDQQLQDDIHQAVEACKDDVSWVMFRDLMAHYRNEQNEESIAIWQMMMQLGSALSISRHHEEAFASVVSEQIRLDKDETFLSLGRVIKDLEEDFHQQAFGLAMTVLARTHSIHVLHSLVELIRSGTLSLERFLRPGVRSLLGEDLEEKIVSICLSHCLHQLLQNGGYDPEEYLYTLNQLILFCEEPALRGRFVHNLQKALKLGIKLDEYFTGLMNARTTMEEFARESHPGRLTRLSFAEVQPFLRQYATALLGNIPINVSQNSIPFTDGSEIFLPGHENKFPDSKKDLYANRNASLFVANLFHEIGFHILAGTFLVDFRPTINQFTNTDLAHGILNVFEDYRGRHHFLSQAYPNNWKVLIKQDERILVRAMPVPDHWKDHFMQLFVAKGTSCITPGELDPTKAEGEKQLLGKRVYLFTPGGEQRMFSLKEILDLVIEKVESLKGKTIADSLLLVKPIYSILSQVLGDDFDLPGQSPGMSADISLKNGSDAFEPGSGQTREEQLRGLAVKIQPLQGARNVPARVEYEKSKSGSSGKNKNSGNMKGGSSDNSHHRGGGEIEKIWFGEYDHITGKEIRNPYPVILKHECRYHPQFELLYQKYRNVFDAMERAMEELEEEEETGEFEGRTPDEIVIESLIEGLADPQAIPFLDLYENEAQPEREKLTTLEVKILVDASGSTSGTILEVEKVFASVMYKAFQSMEFDVELYFFNGDKETYIYHARDLNAIGQIRSGYANRDGAAIRFVTETFQGTGDRSLLIMITDGMPEAENYRDEKAMRDTCHAMEAAGKKGIMVRYFNIGGLPDKILKAFKDHTHHSEVFYQPSELVDYAPKFVKELVKEINL